MKSTITCDMEGVIETMNQDAEKIFGYNKEELVGKKRVSIFSPGEIVLQNVANWLDTAVKDGEYIGETIFVNKKGENINAKISNPAAMIRATSAITGESKPAEAKNF